MISGSSSALGDLERELDPLLVEHVVSGEHVEPRELVGERCEVAVGLVGREHLEGLLHPRDPLVDAAELVEDAPQARGRPGGRMRCSRGLEESDGLLERALRRVESPARPRRLAGALEELAAP